MGKKYMSNFDVIHTIRESVQKGRTVLARVLFGRRSTAWQLPGNPRGRGNHCPLACDASHCQQVVWQGAVSCSEQFFSALHCPPVVGVGSSFVPRWLRVGELPRQLGDRERDHNHSRALHYQWLEVQKVALS